MGRIQKIDFGSINRGGSRGSGPLRFYLHMNAPTMNATYQYPVTNDNSNSSWITYYLTIWGSGDMLNEPPYLVKSIIIGSDPNNISTNICVPFADYKEAETYARVLSALLDIPFIYFKG